MLWRVTAACNCVCIVHYVYLLMNSDNRFNILIVHKQWRPSFFDFPTVNLVSYTKNIIQHQQMHNNWLKIVWDKNCSFFSWSTINNFYSVCMPSWVLKIVGKLWAVGSGVGTGGSGGSMNRGPRVVEPQKNLGKKIIGLLRKKTNKKLQCA